MSETTATVAATEIYSQMSTEDRTSFDSAEWYDGISGMLVDDWADLDLHDVLAELERLCYG
jgi:hypothetical protein